MRQFDLSGAIDLHVHTSPDVYPRRVSDDELGEAAGHAGMRGLLLKSHHTLTADRATLLANRTGMAIFGGLALNHTVGGLNPVAVETAIAMGARMIWMPTLHSRHCLEHAEHEMFRAERDKGRPGISILDDDGELRDVVKEIVALVRDADIALSTGHVSPREGLALLAYARDEDVRQTVVTHPHMAFTRYPPDAQHRAVELGALLEFDVLSCTEGWAGALPAETTAAAIAAVGPQHCLVATDGGQAWNPPPTEMLADFAARLVELGLKERDVRSMFTRQPARVLGLE